MSMGSAESLLEAIMQKTCGTRNLLGALADTYLIATPLDPATEKQIAARIEASENQ
jgi:hypothetical protein